MTTNEILTAFNAPAGARLVKVFKNGNIQIERNEVCDRCGNKDGIYYIGVCNGRLVPSHVDNGVCFKCLGSGFMRVKEIIRTPENEEKYQRELARKAEQARKAQEEREAEEARLAEERRAEEERLEAERKAEEVRQEALRLAEETRKANSQYIGNAGEKLEIKAVYLFSAFFKVQDFYNRNSYTTVYIHNFSDENGNTLIWKTERSINIEKGFAVTIKGTIKDHSEYKNEKQTILTRCKVEAI